MPRDKIKHFLNKDGTSAFIVLDKKAGMPNVYTVIRLISSTTANIIGRELPLDLALRVAKRSSEEDSLPLE